MRILLILAGLALSLAAASQEIYRWVDKDGIVHFSDQPGAPNAELITVIEPNSFDSETAGTAANASASEPEDEEEDAGASPYESLAIVSPGQDEVFFGSDATVTIAAELDGTLQPDHSVAFFVNGNRRPASGLSLELANLERGTHFVRASILDQNGKPVISSQQTSFHVRQNSIQNPRNPQNRPPTGSPPRPRPTPLPAPARPPSP